MFAFEVTKATVREKLKQQVLDLNSISQLAASSLIVIVTWEGNRVVTNK
jgi:hypothetical protein